MAACVILLPFSFIGFFVARIVSSLVVFAASVKWKSYLKSGDEGFRFAKAVLVALINIFYFVPLIVIAHFRMEPLRLSYLVYAIGANLIVKLIDYDIKRVNGGHAVSDKYIFTALMTGVMLAIAIFSAIYNPYYMLCLVPVLFFVTIRRRAINEHWA